MGALDCLIFRLKRWRHRWRTWRHNRRTQHEHAVISLQQNQISAQQAAWESEVQQLQSQIKRLHEEFDRERRDKESVIKVLAQENSLQHDLLAREKERVAYETAKFARGVAEYENESGRIVT